MTGTGGTKPTPGPPLSRRSPFYRGFFWTLGAFLALLVALAVREAASALVLVLVAAFLAVGLEPIVGYAGRRGVRRRWAVLAIALLLLVVVGTVVYVLGTLVHEQVSDLIDKAPALLDDLRRNRTVAKLDAKYHIISSLQDQLTSPDLARSAFGGAFGFGIGVFNAIANSVIVFVLLLYFLGSLPTIKAGLYSLAPASRRARVTELGDEIVLRVGRYAIGAVAVGLIAGTVTAIFCACVGLGAYALPLGILVALLDLVPLVGAILGAGIVCVVGFATSLTVGIVCVIFYLVYEALEGYVIYPRHALLGERPRIRHDRRGPRRRRGRRHRGRAARAPVRRGGAVARSRGVGTSPERGLNRTVEDRTWRSTAARRTGCSRSSRCPRASSSCWTMPWTRASRCSVPRCRSTWPGSARSTRT